MKKVKCFTYEESVTNPGWYTIVPVHDNFHLNYTEGSFNVICARLLNIKYSDYLRLCRDVFGAEIRGKNWKYPHALFKRSNEFMQLIELLNARANFILYEREHPNYSEKEAFLKEYDLKFMNREGGDGN